MAILILVIIINFILPVLVESINELIGNLENYYNKVIETYNNLPEDSVFKTERVYNALKEIQNFKPEEYWIVKTIFEKDKKEFEALLYKIDDKKIDKLHIKNKELSDKILTDLKDSQYKVLKIISKERKR